MKKPRKSHSFVTICLIQSVIYSLIVLGVLSLFNSIINRRLENSFPVLEDLLVYEEALVEDRFSAIPLRELPNCSFLVFDESNRLIYATDKKLRDHINQEKLEFISNYYATSYFQVLNEVNDQNELQYLIFLNGYDEEKQLELVKGYARVDQNFQILEGTLFQDRTFLTKKEFNLMRGSDKDGRNIEKYTYQTNTGENRTLVFASPQITMRSYNWIVAKTYGLWWFAIFLIVLLIGIETWLFSRKIKRPLRTLNQAITSYEQGQKLSLDRDQLPKEFRAIIDNFDWLLYQLNESEQEKEKIYNEKQRIFADVSHDLKTPLTVIRGYAKAFLDHVVPKQKERQYMETIYHKTLVTSELIDSLFEYAKLEHPEYSASFKEMDLCAFSQAYFAEKYPELEEKKFSLEMDLPDKKVMYPIDAKLMKRLFENLVSNAIKYNPPGTTIFFSIKEENTKIRMVIADNGVGIQEPLAQHLFEPFVTSNQARTSENGTGLGMTIAKKIVEQHGGEIFLNPTLKRKYRTEFHIVFYKK